MSVTVDLGTDTNLAPSGQPTEEQAVALIRDYERYKEVAPTCTKIPVAPGVDLEIHNLEDGPITDVVLVKNGKQLWLSPGEAIAAGRALLRAMTL